MPLRSPRAGMTRLFLLTSASWLWLFTSGAICAQDGQTARQVNQTARYVKVDVVAGKPDATGKQELTVQLSIDKACYLFANAVGNADFDAAKTNVTIKAAGKAIPAKITYPAGTVVKDKGFGDYRIYEGKITIRATVERPGDVNAPLVVEVRMLGTLVRPTH